MIFKSLHAITIYFQIHYLSSLGNMADWGIVEHHLTKKVQNYIEK